jgi:ABC-2 type transport system permease protein
MVIKEFRQVFRDPRMARVILVAPVIQLLVFGYAVSTDIANTGTFLVDHDRSGESRALVDTLTASGYFRIVARSDRPEDLVRALERGDAVVGLTIPVNFARDLRSERGARVQILLDGTNSNTASIAQGYAERIVADFARRQSPGFSLPVELRDRPWFNPNLESRDYNVPAVMGTIMMMMSLLLTSLAVVRERELGTLEQLMVSPLTPTELILGKTLPVVFVALVQLTLVTAVTLLWFEVPLRGSFVVLAVASLTFILSGLGIGLLISTLSQTQQEAFMSMFFFFLPAIMLSGFMFPIANMPVALQYLTLLDPIRHYLVIVRGVFLRGAGWSVLFPEILTLLLMGLTLLWFATTRFRKTTA